MGGLTTHIVRQADRTLSRVQGRLKRFLESESRAKKRALKLTLGKAYEQKWENMQCVYALSTGRTGTQTLAAILRLSPRVVAQHEPAPRLVMATYEAYMEAASADWIEKWSPFVLAARDDFVLEANASEKVYVESNNRLTYVAKALQSAFPASKFIFLIVIRLRSFVLACSGGRTRDQEKHGILPGFNPALGSPIMIPGTL